MPANANIAAIAQLVRGLCMVRGVDTVPRGHLRLETKFQYPDRSSIDLFVVDGPQGVLEPSAPVLSDLGQTMTWLADVQVRPWQSKKRQRILEDTLYTLGVRQSGGALGPVLDDRQGRLAREPFWTISDAPRGAEQTHVAERRQDHIVECGGTIEISDAQREVVEHGQPTVTSPPGR